MATDTVAELIKLAKDTPWVAGIYLAARNIPGVLAIICAEKGTRGRVCLEVLRLRRKDAEKIPSYLDRAGGTPALPGAPAELPPGPAPEEPSVKKERAKRQRPKRPPGADPGPGGGQDR